MKDGKKLSLVAVVAYLTIAAPMATAQVIYECIDVALLDADKSVTSQIGSGDPTLFHQEASQILPPWDAQYRIKNPRFVIGATGLTPPPEQWFLAEDFVGRTVRLKLQIGPFDPGFPEAPTLIHSQDFVLQLDQLVLVPGQAPPTKMFELTLPYTSPWISANLNDVHLTILGVGFDLTAPYSGAGERFIVMRAPNAGPCVETVFGWVAQFVGALPNLPFYAWLSFLSGNADRIAASVPIESAESVPTLSAWGAAAMTLLILTAGTLVYTRRGPVRNVA